MVDLYLQPYTLLHTAVLVYKAFSFRLPADLLQNTSVKGGQAFLSVFFELQRTETEPGKGLI
jgi:hypothetical protein